MNLEAVLLLVDELIFTGTGRHLSDLQNTILARVWQGQKYLNIALHYGCTEGHAKDVASALWKQLSEILGERVNKNNFRTVIKRFLLEKQNINVSLVSQENLDRNFLGREKEIDRLDNLIRQGNKIVVIQGEGGVGKTTLAQQYLKSQKFELVLELLMAKETQNIISVNSIVEEWLKKDLQEEPGREFGVSLGRLKRHLQSRKIGILIDNLEPALNKHGKLISPHRGYVELLRILADPSVKSVTIITSRDRLCESDLNIDRYRLTGLEELDWQQFFSLRQIDTDNSLLKIIHKTYGGNAKAMGIICGSIAEDFDGNLEAYWQENSANPLTETDLKNLVVSQFDRLKNLDSQAYKLLCRLSCYRDLDVPNVSADGVLSLLWDVAEIDRRQIVESLRNRSLVEYAKGKYWLHPVIRAEAIARLRDSKEWEEVNRKAGEFWTEKIKTIYTLEDALTALEAYYHYVEIKDFERAGKVILQSRDNQWQQFLPLGSTLYRLGLLQPVFSAITAIIDKIESEYNLSELYNILGDLYWILGKIDRAIDCQEKTIATATKCLSYLEPNPENKHSVYYLKMLEVDSLLSIGLYKIDLWELAEAAIFFKKVITLASDTPHYRWAEKACVCLALVNSYLGLYEEAFGLIEPIERGILAENLGYYTGRFAYFFQILGQTYFNLGKFDKAWQMYERAINFSQESYYTQVKAKALTGIAAIYRIKQEFSSAYSYHLEAIELLQKIGAKCDLAEAYFQFALTCRESEEIVKSQENFQQAIDLFTAMEAQNQVTKVIGNR